MILKKFSSLTPVQHFLTKCIIAVGSFAFHSPMIFGKAPSSGSDVIPVIHYVGVIPVQWDKDDTWTEMDQIKKSLNKDFSESVKSSRRFSAVNDDLVASLWSTPAGRQELSKDYELQAFVALNVSSRGDMVVLTSRILSPDFVTYLQESDVVPRNWLIESDHKQIVDRLTDLIQRMINRLPIDAHVTSINGEFVTVSAGTYQSISVGDQFDVINPKIETLHPANGSWLTFSSSRSGSIKIIESKGRSSIGKIVSMTRENAIAVNHGIRIEAISGRSRFARSDGQETFIATQTGVNNAIVPEMKVDGTPAKKEPESKPAATAPVVETKKDDGPVKEAAPEEPKKEEASAEKPGESSPTIAEIFAPAGTELEGYAGLRSWSIGGTGTAKAALPVWLINSIGVLAKRHLSETVSVHYGLDLGYGATGKGSSFGYGIHAAGIYKLKIKAIEQADFIFGGLEANIKSLSIGGESSSGYNLTLLNLLIGMGGITNSQMLGMKLDWIADLRYSLQETGQFGVTMDVVDTATTPNTTSAVRSKEKVRSGDGLLLRFMGYVGQKPKEGLQYGGGFEFGTGNYGLSNSASATYNVLSLLGLARLTM
ncbi:MAG: hypothetical protein NT027_14310 [Proteobacteria bacterium]|nr:hypothetical protein [Pseudomonadota bacterium]